MDWLGRLVLALIGAAIGAWLTRRHFQDQRRHSFVERQLEEFYSPLLGLREQIRLKGDVRVKVQATGDEAWRALCAETQKMHDPVSAFFRLQETKFPAFAKAIEYDNEQLRNMILPSYRQMVAIFREKLWLAEPDTRAYLPALIEFVDLWDRWLAESVPGEVIEKLGHSEKHLHPFYEHLEKRHDELRSVLAARKA